MPGKKKTSPPGSTARFFTPNAIECRARKGLEFALLVLCFSFYPLALFNLKSPTSRKNIQAFAVNALDFFSFLTSHTF
jgi:hypothetical protein